MLCDYPKDYYNLGNTDSNSVIGLLSQVTFLVAYLIPGKIYDSFRKTLRNGLIL